MKNKLNIHRFKNNNSNRLCKKVIAVLLTLSLCIPMMSNISYASNLSNDLSSTFNADKNDAINRCIGSMIMTGTDKGYEEDKTLTRAEAATILTRFKGISVNNYDSCVFIDVPKDHWAYNYINACYSYGLIKGISDNEFAPDKEVSVAEFYTMAVRALGAGKLVDSEGTWPTNYVNFAIENDLAEDVAQVYTATATRMTAAIIAANALEAKMWEKTGVKSNGEITWSNVEGKTILEDTLKIEKYESALIGNIDTKEYEVDYVSIAEDKLGDPIYEGSDVEVDKVVELSSIKTGIEYDFWYNTNTKKIVAIFKANDSKQNTVEFTEVVKVDSTDGKITLKVNGADKKYKYTDNDVQKTCVYYNSNKTAAAVKAGTAPFAAAGNKNLFGTAIIKNDTVETIFAEEYTNVALVKEVKNDTIYFDDDLELATIYSANTKSSIKYDDEKNEYVITKEGKEIAFDSIEEGDVVFFYIQAKANTASAVDKYVMEVVNDSVDGKVTSYKTDKYIKLDGQQIDVLEGFTLETDKTITGYLNKAGKMAAYMVDEEETETDLAVVTSFRETKDKYSKTAWEVEKGKIKGLILRIAISI